MVLCISAMSTGKIQQLSSVLFVVRKLTEVKDFVSFDDEFILFVMVLPHCDSFLLVSADVNGCVWTSIKVIDKHVLIMRE